MAPKHAKPVRPDEEALSGISKVVTTRHALVKVQEESGTAWEGFGKTMDRVFGAEKPALFLFTMGSELTKVGRYSKTVGEGHNMEDVVTGLQAAFVEGTLDEETYKRLVSETEKTITERIPNEAAIKAEGATNEVVKEILKEAYRKGKPQMTSVFPTKATKADKTAFEKDEKAAAAAAEPDESEEPDNVSQFPAAASE